MAAGRHTAAYGSSRTAFEPTRKRHDPPACVRPPTRAGSRLTVQEDMLPERASAPHRGQLTRPPRPSPAAATHAPVVPAMCAPPGNGAGGPVTTGGRRLHLLGRQVAGPAVNWARSPVDGAGLEVAGRNHGKGYVGWPRPSALDVVGPPHELVLIGESRLEIGRVRALHGDADPVAAGNARDGPG